MEMKEFRASADFTSELLVIVEALLDHLDGPLKHHFNDHHYNDYYHKFDSLTGLFEHESQTDN